MAKPTRTRFLAAAVVTSIVLVFPAAGPQGSPATVGGNRPASVASRVLPGTDSFGSIAVVGNRLVLGGQERSDACVTAALDPATLRVGTVNPSDLCGVTIGAGQRVGYEVTLTDQNNVEQLWSVVVRPSGRAVVGPMLASWQEAAGSGPWSAYGGGWLWIYFTPPVGATSTVLQLSTSSGRLVHTITLPSSASLGQPFVAANDAGLWFGASPEGGRSPAARGSLFLLAQGTSQPTVVMGGTRTLCWMVGQGTRLWVGVGGVVGGCARQDVAGYLGTDPTPAFMRADPYHPFPVVVGGRGGLWDVVENRQSNPTRSLVLRIDPDTGHAAVVAQLPSMLLDSGGSLGPEEAATYDGSLFVLGGYRDVFRISLR